MAVSLDGAVVLATLAVTITVGAVANPTLADLPRPPWQPADGAFAIWAVIYTAVAAGGVLRLLPAVATRANAWSVALLCASLLCSAAWLLSVRRAAGLSAAFIVAASATSLLAVALAHPPPAGVADRTVALGPALLAGWLSVAAPLGVNVAVQRRGGAPLPAWAVLPSTLAAALVGGAAGAPGVGAALAWAALFSPRTGATAALGALGVASAAVAVFRSLPARP